MRLWTSTGALRTKYTRCELFRPRSGADSIDSKNFRRYYGSTTFQPDLGGNDHPRAQPTLADGPANDLFRAAEAIGRGRIDDIDAVIECGPDRGNPFSLVKSSHLSPRCRSPRAIPSATCREWSRAPCRFRESRLTCHRCCPVSSLELAPSADQPAFNCAGSIGSARMRLPVAAKIALQIAGAIAGTPGSPTPPGGAWLSTMWT
jgi:hypothetical protein